MAAPNWPARINYGLWLTMGLPSLLLLSGLFAKSLATAYLSAPEHKDLSASFTSLDNSNDYFCLTCFYKADLADLLPAHVQTQDYPLDKRLAVFMSG